MVEHRILISAIIPHLRMKSGESLLRKNHQQAWAHELRGQVITNPTRMVTETFIAGGRYATGLRGGGYVMPTSEPYHA